MITDLAIQNYKCFERQQFNLAPLTLLAGLNGAGKSSVIQSLLLLRQSYEQGMLQETGLSLNGDYVQIGAAKDALYEKAQTDSFGFRLGFDGGGFGDWAFTYDAKGDVVASARAETSGDVFKERLFSDRFEYLQAERIGPRTQFPTSDYLVRRKRHLGTKGEFATHFLSYFGRRLKVERHLAHPNATSDDLIDQVEAWLGEISPGARLHFTPYAGTDAVNLEYSFLYGSEASERYRATNVGFGITYALPIIVAILASGTDTIILLENPEAHVHPKGQIKIGRLLAIAASRGAQVVVETHSDHVLNGIRLAIHGGLAKPQTVALYYLRRSLIGGVRPPEVTRISVDSAGRLGSRPAGFFDEFNSALDALLDKPKPYGGVASLQ